MGFNEMARGKSTKTVPAASVAVLHVLFRCNRTCETIVATTASIKELRRGRARTMETLIKKLNYWREERTPIVIELPTDAQPSTSTQIDQFDRVDTVATVIYFSELLSVVVSHKKVVDEGWVAKKTTCGTPPAKKASEEDSEEESDEETQIPKKRTRTDSQYASQDMFAEDSYNEDDESQGSDEDGQKIPTDESDEEEGGNNSLLPKNGRNTQEVAGVVIQRLRNLVFDYKVKCQQLESDLSSKDESIARMTGEIKELNDLLHMDPAQQMASLVMHLNGTLEKLKTELTDARKHTKELELSSKQRNDSSATASRRFDDGAKQIQLAAGMPLQINAADLKLAFSYGSVGNGDSNMRSMINKIMESIYTRKYMATHSYTGKASPANKRARIPAKPALPVDDRKAIRVFVTAYWSKKHKMALSPKLISMAIQDKLGTEHREWKRIGRTLQQRRDAALPDEGHNADEHGNNLMGDGFEEED